MHCNEMLLLLLRANVVQDCFDLCASSWWQVLNDYDCYDDFDDDEGEEDGDDVKVECQQLIVI